MGIKFLVILSNPVLVNFSLLTQNCYLQECENGIVFWTKSDKLKPMGVCMCVNLDCEITSQFRGGGGVIRASDFL